MARGQASDLPDVCAALIAKKARAFRGPGMCASLFAIRNASASSKKEAIGALRELRDFADHALNSLGHDAGN